jgi:hypothetical protein
MKFLLSAFLIVISFQAMATDRSIQDSSCRLAVKKRTVAKYMHPSYSGGVVSNRAHSSVSTYEEATYSLSISVADKLTEKGYTVYFTNHGPGKDLYLDWTITGAPIDDYSWLQTLNMNITKTMDGNKIILFSKTTSEQDKISIGNTVDLMPKCAIAVKSKAQSDETDGEQISF